jgi:CO dehydrogenase/acetyl-CoA synthase gamma subunit (corrinoid Fe-S protein)
MVVEQEFAELYPLTEENLMEYLSDIDCGDCGFSSCVAFAEALIGRNAKSAQCSELDPRMASILDTLLEFDLPVIPYNVMMENFDPGLIKINNPGESSPVMVTCNFHETVDLLEKILTISGVKSVLLMSDTKGYSVDNAIEKKRFTPFEIMRVITETEVGSCVTHRNLMIPGLAKHMAGQIRQATGWNVVVGPVSGLEIPLFLVREGLGEWTDS